MQICNPVQLLKIIETYSRRFSILVTAEFSAFAGPGLRLEIGPVVLTVNQREQISTATCCLENILLVEKRY
jgi:hypothetical protein